MRKFDYYQPKDFAEAFELLLLPDKVVMPLAGATDIIPLARDGHIQPDVVVDIKSLPGMREIKATEKGLLVGAAVRMNEIASSPLVREHATVLAEGAATVGHVQVRNRATLGGNMCTASPAGDTFPALLVLEAEVLIRGVEGERSVPVLEFFKGPRRTALHKGELVVGVLLPKLDGAQGHYTKLSRRKVADLTLVGVAALAIPSEAGYVWRLALGAVAPTPVRVPAAEQILSQGYAAAAIEQAAVAAHAACSPIDDIRSSAEYRREMVVNITKRAIGKVIEKLP
ncbi:MAG: xanthine dehydrogenase family protein subunit M [Chloroflexota bacterium]|nr:xanthine dehydrogenase family protein subunit M [Chloroflexota bacterium]